MSSFLAYIFSAFLAYRMLQLVNHYTLNLVFHKCWGKKVRKTVTIPLSIKYQIKYISLVLTTIYDKTKYKTFIKIG